MSVLTARLRAFAADPLQTLGGAPARTTIDVKTLKALVTEAADVIDSLLKERAMLLEEIKMLREARGAGR